MYRTHTGTGTFVHVCSTVDCSTTCTSTTPATCKCTGYTLMNLISYTHGTYLHIHTYICGHTCTVLYYVLQYTHTYNIHSCIIHEASH